MLEECRTQCEPECSSDLSKLENNVHILNKVIIEILQLTEETLSMFEHGNSAPVQDCSELKDCVRETKRENRFQIMSSMLTDDCKGSCLRISQKLNKIKDLVR